MLFCIFFLFNLNSPPHSALYSYRRPFNRAAKTISRSWAWVGESGPSGSILQSSKQPRSSGSTGVGPQRVESSICLETQVLKKENTMRATNPIYDSAPLAAERVDSAAVKFWDLIAKALSNFKVKTSTQATEQEKLWWWRSTKKLQRWCSLKSRKIWTAYASVLCLLISLRRWRQGQLGGENSATSWIEA